MMRVTAYSVVFAGTADIVWRWPPCRFHYDEIPRQIRLS